MSFEKELETLINKHSKENESDTPDFLLARFLIKCLNAYSECVKPRDEWYGFNPWPKEEVTINEPQRPRREGN